jgi:hypothetical protein
MAGEMDAAACRQLVQGLWSEALERDDICPSDDFFDVGGHSLAALMIHSRLQHLLQVDIPLSTVFDQPVLSEFADTVCRILSQSPPAFAAAQSGDQSEGRDEYRHSS